MITAITMILGSNVYTQIVEGFLTSEQKAKWRDAHMVGPPFSPLAPGVLDDFGDVWDIEDVKEMYFSEFENLLPNNHVPKDHELKNQLAKNA